ncbi:DnaJ domain protein [Trichuris suis]|nr:DnaJ domain protein [Trichuris suis]
MKHKPQGTEQPLKLKPALISAKRINCMAFKADCERYFGSSCLYDLLGISKGAECSNGQLSFECPLPNSAPCFRRVLFTAYADLCDPGVPPEKGCRFSFFRQWLRIAQREAETDSQVCPLPYSSALLRILILSEDRMKAAYYKAALRYHPDRCGSDDKQVATAKFQLISRAFSILSDNEKRDLYDRTGSLDDDELYEDPNWFSAWGRMFNVVTVDSIEAFMKRYQGIAF